MPDEKPIDPAKLDKIIRASKKLARQYKKLTGRPLGVTAEIAEYEAARLLGLRLAPPRQCGYDAVRTSGSKECKLQIKGRCLPEHCKSGQRVGGIKLNQPWDVVLLVMLDAEFEPVSIHEAQRHKIAAAIQRPGSKARNERGALSVKEFQSIGRCVWSRSGISN